MIDGVPPYAAMKESGVPWLGEVPKHWEVAPAIAAYRPKLAKNVGMAEKTVLSLSYGRIVVKPPEKLHGLVPESFETYQIVDPGNIVVRTTDLQNDRNSLRVGYARSRGIITSAYMCLETTDRISNEFGYQFLNAYDLLKIIYGFGSGLRQNLDFSDIKRMPVLIPPMANQFAIVRFLNYADRRIRRYIGAKQKLIKLLEEQRQVIIHRSVTRGLDTSVSFKPSGIPWISDVPEHWEVVPLGRLIQLTTGYPFKSEGFSQAEDDIRLLRGINIAPGRIRWNTVVRWPVSNRHSVAEFELKSGDIVLGMDRPIVNGGVRVAAIREFDVPSLLLQRVARIRPLGELLTDFALLLLGGKSFSDYLEPIFTGISVPHVSPEQIKAFRLALPSIEEQALIVKHAKGATVAVNTAVDRAQREISLLREYRTRLIADVVTGKLDVRKAAASMPEIVEDEPIDEIADSENIDEAIEDTENEEVAA